MAFIGELLMRSPDLIELGRAGHLSDEDDQLP